MQDNKESSVVKFLKIVFTIIAVVTFIFVVYNIGVYTNDQNVEVFAGVETGFL